MVARVPRAGSLLLLLHHLRDQPEDLLDTGGLGLTGGEGLPPLREAALGRELVERRARDLEPHARIARDVLGDLWARHLDPVDLDVAAAAQLEPRDELEGRQRRHL